MAKSIKKKFEGKIEPLNDLTPFYMVVVEGSIYPTTQKHKTYDSCRRQKQGGAGKPFFYLFECRN